MISTKKLEFLNVLGGKIVKKQHYRHIHPHGADGLILFELSLLNGYIARKTSMVSFERTVFIDYKTHIFF